MNIVVCSLRIESLAAMIMCSSRDIPIGVDRGTLLEEIVHSLHGVQNDDRLAKHVQVDDVAAYVICQYPGVMVGPYAYRIVCPIFRMPAIGNPH